MLCKETVTSEMWELLQRLMKDENLKDHILVGGTALALRLGHRLSVDIDLLQQKILIRRLCSNICMTLTTQIKR